MTPVSKILGIKWDIRHGEKLIGHNKSAVCIANHQSMYDIVGRFILIKGRCIEIYMLFSR